MQILIFIYFIYFEQIISGFRMGVFYFRLGGGGISGERGGDVTGGAGCKGGTLFFLNG